MRVIVRSLVPRLRPLREGKGLVIEQFLGFAESSLPRACAKDSVLIVKNVKHGEFAESVTNDCITSCDISRKLQIMQSESAQPKSLNSHQTLSLSEGGVWVRDYSSRSAKGIVS